MSSDTVLVTCVTYGIEYTLLVPRVRIKSSCNMPPGL